MGGIFISYRRDDSAGYAGRLYDRLAARFGSDTVFMDVAGIEPGTDFVVAIEKAVGSCAVLIVLIGDEWLSVTDAAGKRRLDDPHDFIRLETATALQRDIRVVPVLLDGAPMPPADSLPEELRMLTRRQAVEVSHKQWESSTGELIRTLERILDQPPMAAAPGMRPRPPTTGASTGSGTGIASGSGTGNGKPPLPMGKILAAAALIAALAGLAWFFNAQHDTAAPAGAPPDIARTDVHQPDTPQTDASQPDTTPQPAQAPVAVEPTEAPAAPPAPVKPADAGTPRLVALVPKVDFGSTRVETSLPGAVRFGNEGTAPAALAGARLEGTDAGSFRIVVSTCDGVLAAGRTCEVNLSYRPLSPGARSASLVVALADASQKASVSLAGSATAAPPPAPRKPEPPGAAPAPEAVAAPRISTVQSISEEGGARICYRISAADSVELLPAPGPLDKTSSDCVKVSIDRPTRFTLTARNKGGSTHKTVLASPSPAASPAAAAEPAAPPVEAATPQTSKADSRLPRVGEQWHYRSRGKWPTSPKRSFQVTVRSVDGPQVQEQLVQTEPPARSSGESRNSAGAGFVSWNEIGTEFGPYLGAFTSLADGRSWRNMPTPDQGAYWTQWYSEAKVLGRESISVPAGRFAATKVEVWSSRRATGSTAEAQLEPVRIRYLVWYAPEAKRYVRMERKVISANGSEIENDVFELVAHRGG